MLLPLLSAALLPSCILAFSKDTDLSDKENVTNLITDEVFFDMKIESKKSSSWRGRIVVGVFGDALPITAFNFVNLAVGYKHRDERWHYKGSRAHFVVPDLSVQMGDVVFKDGRGGRSVYAPYFIDEDFVHSFKAAGYVAMANAGVDLNHSQFFITMTKARWLDERNVIFGKVVSGMNVIKKIGDVETDPISNAPVSRITIVDCGVLPLSKPYELTEEQLKSDEDIKKGPSMPEEPPKKK